MNRKEIRNQKAKGKRQKAKMKNQCGELIKWKSVFIFAFCLLPFAF